MLSTVTRLNKEYSPLGASSVLPCLAAPADLFLGVNMKHIPLTQGQFQLLACFIDDDKIPLLIEWRREDTDTRGLPLEIELIEKSEADHGTI